jgi:two-component system sensor histidine kinase QseC
MRSIQRQLTLRILLAVLAIAGAAGTFLYLYARSSLLAEFDDTLAAKAKLVAGMVTCDEQGRLEFNASDAEMAEFRRAHRPAYFEVWAAAPFARAPSLAGRDLPRPPTAEKSSFFDLPLFDGTPGRAAVIRFIPRRDADDPPGAAPARAPGTAADFPTLTLVVAQDRHELDETLRVLATSLALAAVAMAAGAAIAVVVSVRRGLRPLNQLARQADSVSAGTLDQQFPTSGIPAELEPICHGLNNLLTRLSRAFARERRFTADAAHELRTPIAELRALAEVAIKWPKDASGEQNYRDVLHIAKQMETLVTALLAIARQDAGNLPIQLSCIDFAGVVRDAWAPYESAALSRRLLVEWDLPAAVAVRSDPALLAPLVGNLFSNAVAYTPEGGRIVCRITLHGNKAALEISNHSERLCDADLPHLFEPFWRKDPARGGTTHTGLGLTLVQTYANALGLNVTPRLCEGVFSVIIGVPMSGSGLHSHSPGGRREGIPDNMDPPRAGISLVVAGK